jgi:hypothetical protein
MDDNSKEKRQGKYAIINGIINSQQACVDNLTGCQILLKGKCSGSYLKCFLCEFKDREIMFILHQKMILKAREDTGVKYY